MGSAPSFHCCRNCEYFILNIYFTFLQVCIVISLIIIGWARDIGTLLGYESEARSPDLELVCVSKYPIYQYYERNQSQYHSSYD
jgi:hypothetical protein